MSDSLEQGPSYSAQPKKRRGNRRASGGSAFSGEEPRLAGLEPLGAKEPETAEDERARWLKEQRPPHYQSP